MNTQPRHRLSESEIAHLLDSNGWKRSIANRDGTNDFERVVKGLKLAQEKRKGLYLKGVAGVGKTKLLETIHKINRADQSRFLSCSNARHLQWMDENPEFYLDQSIYIDELGIEDDNEKKKFVNFKRASDIVASFIHMYYSRGKGKMYVATNYEGPRHETMYTTPIVDRLLDMCVCVSFDGQSKRSVDIV